MEDDRKALDAARALGFRGDLLVLAYRMGKPRSFWRGFFLTIVTLGIYRYYWIYKAPNEVYKQFELDREGRDDSIVWLVLGLVIAPLILVYDWKAVNNVKYVRDRLSLKNGISPGLYVGLPVGIAAVGFVFLIAAEISTPADALEMTPGAELLTMIALGILAIALIVNVWTYAHFQDDINQVWHAFDQRAQELSTAPAPPLPAPASERQRYVCPRCQRVYSLPTLPAPGTICPVCRKETGG